MSTYRIYSGTSHLEFDDQGAHIRSAVLKGKNILMQSPDGHQTHGGAAVLIPFANRIRDATYVIDGTRYFLPRNNGQHSIHGLTRERTWNVTSIDDRSELYLRLEDSGYPGILDCRIVMKISTSSFSVSMNFVNISSKDQPLSPGMHPYFLFNGSWRITEPSNLHMLEYRDSYFPTGRLLEFDRKLLSSESGRKFDNCFLMGNRVGIDLGDHRIRIDTENMPYFVVYNGEYSLNKSVAVEPMVGAPDAFNNGIGLKIMKPGESFSCRASFHEI